MYSKLGFDKFLCPPVGQQFHLTGKFISNIYSQISVVISRCNSTLDATCANDTYFTAIENQLTSFRLNVPFINTLINPGNQQYRSYYLDDSNGFSFSSQLGAIT